jgi:PhnB protein
MFNGRCEEALNFYKKALGAEVPMLMRFKDAPDSAKQGGMMPPGSENKVMHARMQVGGSTIMASDGCDSKPLNYEGITLSLTAPDPSEAERFFNGLADGGNVKMPLGKTFFSPAFGMVSDRFGVNWTVYVEQHMP